MRGETNYTLQDGNCLYSWRTRWWVFLIFFYGINLTTVIANAISNLGYPVHRVNLGKFSFFRLFAFSAPS